MGRSNSGKSKLINTLLKKDVATVGKKQVIIQNHKLLYNLTYQKLLLGYYKKNCFS